MRLSGRSQALLALCGEDGFLRPLPQRASFWKGFPPRRGGEGPRWVICCEEKVPSAAVLGLGSMCGGALA